VSRSRGSISGRRALSKQALSERNVRQHRDPCGTRSAVRAEFAAPRNLSASLHGSAGVLLYDRDFPAGASRYEFMLRYGTTVSYRLNDRRTFP